MRLEAGNPRDLLDTFGGHFLPGVWRLPRNMQLFGNDRHVAVFAQAPDRRIKSSRHRDDPCVACEAASFELLTLNVKQNWKGAE